jgi:superfamily II DNA or RNA helicase
MESSMRRELVGARTLPLNFGDAPIVTDEVVKSDRPYQSKAVTTFRTLVASNVKRILGVAPVAAGKMYLTASMIRTSTLPVLFIAHRRELLDQCADQLRSLGITNVSILRGNDERYDSNSSIQIASVATLARRDKPFAIERDGKLVGDKILIFIDECHRAASDSYMEILDFYPDAIVIGFTATPVRLDGRPLGGELFEQIFQIATYDELLKNPEWLARPEAFGAPIKPQLDHVPVRDDFNEDALGVAMHNDTLEGQVISHWLKHAGRYYPADRNPGEHVYGERRRTFVFAVNVSHSMSLAERFEKAGVRVEHLDGTTKDSDRKAILKALAVGELEVVCNCNIAIEGVDIPPVKCIVQARPTHSITMHRQQVGREMRPWRNARGELVTPVLLDHAGNWDRLGCPWEDLAWSLKHKPMRKHGAPMKLCKVCFAYCEAGRVVCPFCNSEFQRESRSSMPSETTAELVARQSEPDVMKRDFFSRQMLMAKTKGFKPGYASALFRERYGDWPPKAWGEKAKADFENDVQWQETLRIRLERKEKRDAQEKREMQAMDTPGREKTEAEKIDVDREMIEKAFASKQESAIDMAMIEQVFASKSKQTEMPASKSFEERKLEQSLASMGVIDEPVMEVGLDPWALATDVGTDFDDWLQKEGVK